MWAYFESDWCRCQEVKKATTFCGLCNPNICTILVSIMCIRVKSIPIMKFSLKNFKQRQSHIQTSAFWSFRYIHSLLETVFPKSMATLEMTDPVCVHFGLELLDSAFLAIQALEGGDVMHNAWINLSMSLVSFSS